MNGSASVTVLVTTARVAPGLLTATAWDLVRTAGQVVVVDRHDSTAVALAAERVNVREEPRLDAPDPWPLLTRIATETDGATVFVPRRGDARWARPLARTLVGSGDAAPRVEVVLGSYDLPGARLLDLVEVMQRLRQECPWDREQTHASLARYLLEETYEVLETLDALSSAGADPDAVAAARLDLREELGDLLFQVYFHASIAAEDADEPWTIDEVAAGIVDKLVRRHPHVFAGQPVADAAEVEANWERIKGAEKQRSSVLDGVPTAMPALARADKILSRLDRAGLDVVGLDVVVGGRRPRSESGADGSGGSVDADWEPGIGPGGSGGSAGSAGPAGSAGSADSAGSAGSAGPTGSAGSTGSTSSTGSTGSTGSTSSTASAGSTSSTGSLTADEVVGERLLAQVRAARAAGVDPEQALRAAVDRLSADVRARESPPSPQP